MQLLNRIVRNGPDSGLDLHSWEFSSCEAWNPGHNSKLYAFTFVLFALQVVTDDSNDKYKPVRFLIFAPNKSMSGHKP